MKPLTRITGHVVSGMPVADYFAAEGVNNSLLKDMAISPAHAHALHLSPHRPERLARPWMITGSLAHCTVLEHDALADRYIVVPADAPRRPSAAQWAAKNPSAESAAAMRWWKQFYIDGAGREIVTAEQFANSQSQLAAIRADASLSALLANGQPEQSVFWTDRSTGLKCKARPDFVHQLADDEGVILIDLKTAADASPDAFSKTVAKLGYHRQAAHYSNGWTAATGQRVAAFVFAVVTSAYPFVVVTYILDDETLAQGQDETAELLAEYAQCQASNRWPAFGEGYVMVGLPKWAKRSEELEVSYV